jgi:hypothetical protein
MGIGYLWYLITGLPCLYSEIMFKIEAWRLRRELEKLDSELWDTREDWDESDGEGSP